MIDPASQAQLKEAIADCIGTGQGGLDTLREEIRPLRGATRRIKACSTTSISLVGTDGGNNQLQFAPFLIQLVRVVDSSNNKHCLEAVSPTTPIQKLNKRQFNADGSPKTALGKMMAFLEVDGLSALCHGPEVIHLHSPPIRIRRTSSRAPYSKCRGLRTLSRPRWCTTTRPQGVYLQSAGDFRNGRVL